ncbi:MAG: hypothetical protein J0H98_07200 [Solirubrobacterales bacterium]|nr:hypothetical protein [Solirubrobacterales bacterium]
MKNAKNTRIQTTHGLTTRADNKKVVRRGSRSEVHFGPEIETADKLTGPAAEARGLMEYHRSKAQEAITNAISRGSSRADAMRHARGHLLAGQKAQIQYRAELVWAS